MQNEARILISFHHMDAKNNFGCKKSEYSNECFCINVNKNLHAHIHGVCTDKYRKTNLWMQNKEKLLNWYFHIEPKQKFTQFLHQIFCETVAP